MEAQNSEKETCGICGQPLSELNKKGYCHCHDVPKGTALFKKLRARHKKWLLKQGKAVVPKKDRPG